MGNTPHFETLVMERLAACELGRRELAEGLGYRRPGKAHSLVDKWMRRETVPKGSQLDRLAAVLEIDSTAIEEAKGADKLAAQMRKKQLLVDFPAYRLQIRVLYGTYVHDTLPEGISEAEAVERASMIAAEWRRPLCMTSPGNKDHYWFDKTGKLDNKKNGPGPCLFGGWMEGMWISAREKKAEERAARAEQFEKTDRYFLPARSDRPTRSEEPLVRVLQVVDDAGRLADGRPYVYERAYSADDGTLTTTYFFDATDLENADTKEIIMLLALSKITVIEAPFHMFKMRYDLERTRDARGLDIWEFRVVHFCDD